jgi:hypothetical protein
MPKPKKPLRVSIGKELQRFGRRIAAQPTTGDADPGHRIYDAHELHLLLNRIYDLPEVKIDGNRRPTINVLVPAFEFKSMSAGFFGVFQVARFLRSTDWNVRLVLFDNFDFSMERFRKKFRDYPGMEDLLDEVEVEYIGERKQPLHVSPDDVCVATVWYSAHFAKKIGDVLGGRRFLYLVQDYETNFFPGGSLFALADETYGFDYAALFSTAPLADSFRQSDIGGFASRGLPGMFFNNACSASLASRDDFLAMNAGKPKRKLVFYSRPIVDRNMFNLAALSLITAYEQGVFDPAEWECIGMGLGDALLELLPDVFSTSLPRMTLREYEQTVGQFDVCLTLMASPHPSLIPMDCAGSGAMVVTNTFRTKTGDYLRGLCGNVIPVAPSVPAIVKGLAEAAAASGDLEGRYRRARAMAYPRTWEESLTQRHTDFVTEHVLAPALASAGRTRRRAASA